MTFIGDANARPPRCSFTDLRTGTIYEMPFTPEKLAEEVVANYVDHTVVGLSHEVEQYVNTSNHSFPGLAFDFFGRTPGDVEEIHRGRRFLLSLLYAHAGSSGVRDGAPSRVLFFWPQLVSMTCRIRKIRNQHTQFNREGLSYRWRCTLEFREVRDVRLTSEDVIELGTQRSALSRGV